LEELSDIGTGASIGTHFGDPGTALTHASLKSSLDGNEAGMIMMDGFENIGLKILQKNLAGSTTADNGAEIWFWGVMGFGEPESSEWSENKLLTYRLLGINYTKGDELTESSNTVVVGPDGETLKGVVSDTVHAITADDGSLLQGKFSALSEMKVPSGDSPDAEQMYIAGDSGGDGGFLQIGGVGIFSALLVTVEKQGHSAIDINLAYARF
jgi:hypothetical protein